MHSKGKQISTHLSHLLAEKNREVEWLALYIGRPGLMRCGSFSPGWQHEPGLLPPAQPGLLAHGPWPVEPGPMPGIGPGLYGNQA